MVKYSEIFDYFLDMNKYFRMELFNTITLHTWIKKLKIDNFLNEYANFFVFLEYIYKRNYAIPFFVVKFSKSNKKINSLNPQGIIRSYIHFNSWNNLKKEDFLHFVDVEIVEEFHYKNKKYYRIKESLENDICYYYYHPIQIIQILTLIYSLYKNKMELISIKDFNDYYKKRWSELEFDIVLQGRILSHALKKSMITKEDILSRIESECSKIKEPPFNRYTWLTPKFFKLWIKLESIFQPKYYSPYLIPTYSIYDINISKSEWKKIYKKEANFRKKTKNKELKKFDSEEIKLIQGIIWSMKKIYHDFDGLDDWSDIILEMKRGKKDNLKGILSYFVNIFEVIRTLEIALWDLKDSDEKKRSKKPIFICDAKEYPKYRQRLLIDYELVAEKIIIIYVEGETEYYILNDWLSTFSNRGHFDKIEIQNIKGKTKTSNTFGYIIENFKEKNHFLFLDADNKEKRDDKLNKSILQSVPADSVHFWIPDFVTKNFEIEEIFRAYKNYTRELGIEISWEFLMKLKEELIDAKKNNKSVEKRIEKIQYEFRDKILFPSFSKTDFSKFLSKILIRKCKKGYKPKFEEVLTDFFSKIQGYINEYYERKYSI